MLIREYFPASILMNNSAKWPKHAGDNIVTKKLPVGDVSATQFRELITLFQTTYSDWDIQDIFDTYSTTENLYVYLVYLNDKLVATRQMSLVESVDEAPTWTKDISNISGLRRFAVSSRALVHPKFRNFGYGTNVIEHSNQDIFQQHGMLTVVGKTSNLKALSLYLKLGAKVWIEDIKHIPHIRNMYDFNKIISAPRLTQVQFRQPVRFIYRKEYMPYHWNCHFWTYR